jgi:hypothetical protein
MSNVVEWQPKTAGETVVRYADFTDELASSELISSAGAAVTVWSGNDLFPNNIILSLTIIANSAGINAIVQVNLQAGVLGTLYQCVITGNTNQSNHITKTAVLAIKPPLN